MLPRMNFLRFKNREWLESVMQMSVLSPEWAFYPMSVPPSFRSMAHLVFSRPETAN
jgi:hypothetical protein